MRYIQALQQPRFTALWLSQVLSAFGDQLYLIAIMWMGVQSFGSKAAFIVAASSIARIVFGLLGGILADRLNRGRIMLVSDIVRFLALASLPILAVHGNNNLWHLVGVSAIIGAFSALFDPAMQASLPTLDPSRKTLEPMIGLVDITQRLARAVSPSLAGLLILYLPLQQFFSLDAASFLISAATIYGLSFFIRWKPERATSNTSTTGSAHFSDIITDFTEGWQEVARNRPLAFAIVQTGLIAGLWACAFTVGVPILVKQTLTGSIGSYGLIVGAYGIGNVLGNISLSNLKVRNPYLLLFAADVLLGLGFVALALNHSVPLAMLSCGIAAIGGAIGDLILLQVVMAEVPEDHVGKTLSMRLTVLYAGYSLGLLVAAPIFAHWQPQPVILSCALIMTVAGIAGIIMFGKQSTAKSESACRQAA